MQAYRLRKKFLDFFKAKKHKIVESDSLVPAGDPTVLFTPAGMNQFKKEFLGYTSDFTRAATAQRCLRTDDLDKVGKTGGHHTFFEMLGNFSFGDYFKKEAISYAWEFLTEDLKIPKDKLWVSVYKDDAEAYKIWQDSIRIPAKRIIKLGDKENFWPAEAKEKGPNGPCGPCSEIFFDQGVNIGCKGPDCCPSCNCGRFVEVWNLVFTQFNRKVGGILEPLPKKNIDTGMGLERLAAVMQGVPNNFETDLFQPIVKEIIANTETSVRKEFIYAVSDHIRAIVFAIYDGVLPSNDGRGYVVRKLIRKSRMHLWMMGIKKPFLYTLVPIVSEIMKVPYPELTERRENISEIILAEEKSFISTFHSSDALFKEKFSELFKKPDPERAGKIAFQLYDTFGMPLELTCDWLEKKGINISKEAFDKELLEQKTRSKLQSAMKGDVFGVVALDYNVKETKFLGYKDYSARVKIIKIIKESAETKKITKGDSAQIILDKSVFYPESGGQVGDTGELVKGKNIFEVLDTKKAGKVILHIGKVKAGSFKKGDFVLSKINIERRLSIARNHTATHLLQAALRKVLGVHVQQQGSLVCADKLRFDFTHFKDIDESQLERIEEIVNDYIINNYAVDIKEKSLKEAKKSGALAFFGEKYEGEVRVVSIDDVSCELCGGTHLDSTSQIGIFKIIQEGSIASGVRRIEAVTGKGVHKIIKEQEDKLKQEIEKKDARIKDLEKKRSLQDWDSASNKIDEIIEKKEFINEINLIAGSWDNLDIALLRKAVDTVKVKTGNVIIALGSNNNGKALLVIGVTADLQQKGIDAAKLILEPAKIIGGSGGGRGDFAQAGGNNPLAFPAAFEKLKEIIRDLK